MNKLLWAFAGLIFAVTAVFVTANPAVANPVHLVPPALVEVAEHAVEAKTCISARTRQVVDCPVTTPKGDFRTRGTDNTPLNRWVEVCYPSYDWNSQRERTGQLPHYVSLAVSGENGVRRGIPRYQQYEDMTDAKLLKRRCYKQHYKPGWVIMSITQCRVDGYYTFLSTKRLTAADHGKTVTLEDRSDLRRYAYPVRR